MRGWKKTQKSELRMWQNSERDWILARPNYLMPVPKIKLSILEKIYANIIVGLFVVMYLYPQSL